MPKILTEMKNVIKYLRATHHLFSNVFSKTNRRLNHNYKLDKIALISKAIMPSQMSLAKNFVVRQMQFLALKYLSSTLFPENFISFCFAVVN